ncbi:hypothetical protein HCU40_09510 [Pseudanabaena biceps]|nr:hypothetical protein [Pseudanabaena biceps]
MNCLPKFGIIGVGAIASLAIIQPASAQFVIFVTGNDSATLQRVRTISPNAFPTKINDQPVIQAGTFNSENSADSLAIALQQSGLSAQKYFRSSGGKESNVQVPFPENSATVTNLPSPQQVVIQPNSTSSQVVIQPETQPNASIYTSYPQQTYSQPQYQQITTNTVVPQVQTQQVLVPRWQQVMVPETRQFVTQTVVPQTQIVQTGYAQSGYVQPTTTYVQPDAGFVQTSPQVITPTAFDNSTVAANSYVSTNVQPTSNGFSNEPPLPQQSQSTNFRYVAAVPTGVNNQSLLSRVRQYIPSAFLANSGRGSYINAGAYQSRDSAESVSRYLRSQGLDSRVLYF